MIERIPITSDEQWHRERARDVTASTAPCLLGVHPYLTPFELYMIKTGQLSRDDDGPALRRGRLLEPVAVQLLHEERPGWTFEYPHGVYYRDAAIRLGATPDLAVRDDAGRLGCVQIKTVEATTFRKRWREEGGDIALPLWIAVQANIEGHLLGAEWAAVAAMVVGWGIDLHIIDVPLHAGIVDRVRTEVATFWRGVDLGRPPDPDYARDTKLIEQTFAGLADPIDLSGDNEILALVDERAGLTEQSKTIENRLKAIKGEMLVKLDGHACGYLADGRSLIAKRVNRREYTVAASTYVSVMVKGG